MQVEQCWKNLPFSGIMSILIGIRCLMVCFKAQAFRNAVGVICSLSRSFLLFKIAISTNFEIYRSVVYRQFLLKRRTAVGLIWKPEQGLSGSLSAPIEFINKCYLRKCLESNVFFLQGLQNQINVLFRLPCAWFCDLFLKRNHQQFDWMFSSLLNRSNRRIIIQVFLYTRYTIQWPEWVNRLTTS